MNSITKFHPWKMGVKSPSPIVVVVMKVNQKPSKKVQPVSMRGGGRGDGGRQGRRRRGRVSAEGRGGRGKGAYFLWR
jgi:hypothetical protein